MKKTGISEPLDDFASARKQEDGGKMRSAPERKVEKANKVKSARKDKKTGGYSATRFGGDGAAITPEPVQRQERPV